MKSIAFLLGFLLKCRSGLGSVSQAFKCKQAGYRRDMQTKIPCRNFWVALTSRTPIGFERQYRGEWEERKYECGESWEETGSGEKAVPWLTQGHPAVLRIQATIVGRNIAMVSMNEHKLKMSRPPCQSNSLHPRRRYLVCERTKY